jgi:hypothetical protein
MLHRISMPGTAAVRGVLCFTKADLPLLRTQKIRRHLLLYPKALAKRLNAEGPLQPAVMEQLAGHLAAVLLPAKRSRVS